MYGEGSTDRVLEMRVHQIGHGEMEWDISDSMEKREHQWSWDGLEYMEMSQYLIMTLN